MSCTRALWTCADDPLLLQLSHGDKQPILYYKHREENTIVELMTHIDVIVIGNVRYMQIPNKRASKWAMWPNYHSPPNFFSPCK